MSDAYVIEAALELGDACDPADVGAAVTVALCGAVDHEGPCRWLHNNAIEGAEPARFRTVFLADADESGEVTSRIENALRTAPAWSVLDLRSRQLTADERRLATRLAVVE